MENKAVAVGREHERDIEGHSIIEGLLHSGADAMVIVLGLNDGDGNIGLVIKDIICALGLASGNELTSDDDAPFGEVDLLSNLHHPVPARAFDGGADELGTDIAFAEVFLVHTLVERFSISPGPKTQEARLLYPCLLQTRYFIEGEPTRLMNSDASGN